MNYEKNHRSKTEIRVLAVGTTDIDKYASKTGIKLEGFVDLFNEKENPSVKKYPDVLTAIRAARPDLAVIFVPPYAKNTISDEKTILENGVDLIIQKLRLDS